MRDDGVSGQRLGAVRPKVDANVRVRETKPRQLFRILRGDGIAGDKEDSD